MKIYRIANNVTYWHGTDQPIDNNIFNEQGTTYLGIYASSDVNYARTFGKIVVPVVMNVINPLELDLDDKESPNYSTPSNGEIVLDEQIVGFYRKLNPQTISVLRQRGYDGIKVKYKGVEDFEVVAFDPSQVTIVQK